MLNLALAQLWVFRHIEKYFVFVLWRRHIGWYFVWFLWVLHFLLWRHSSCIPLLIWIQSVLVLIEKAFVGVVKCVLDRLIVMVRVRESPCFFFGGRKEKNRLKSTYFCSLVLGHCCSKMLKVWKYHESIKYLNVKTNQPAFRAFVGPFTYILGKLTLSAVDKLFLGKSGGGWSGVWECHRKKKWVKFISLWVSLTNKKRGTRCYFFLFSMHKCMVTIQDFIRADLCFCHLRRKMNSLPKNENSIVIFSPSCCSEHAFFNTIMNDVL